MNLLKAMFSVSWAALASSILLIAWGVSHLPWRHKEDRFTHWRDAVLLVLLGVIDWMYAAEGYLEVSAMQKVVAPRQLDAQTFEAILREYPKPPEAVEVWVDTTGSEHQRDESIAYGRQFESALKNVGWPVTLTENVGPVDLVGVHLLVHDRTGARIVQAPNGGARLAPEEMPVFDMEGELMKALRDSKVPWQYEFLQPGQPTVRLVIGHQ